MSGATDLDVLHIVPSVSPENHGKAKGCGLSCQQPLAHLGTRSSAARVIASEGSTSTSATSSVYTRRKAVHPYCLALLSSLLIAPIPTN